MAKFKVLKSVAHNIAASFASAANYSVYDYTLGILQAHFRKRGSVAYRIDLLGESESPVFKLFPLESVPETYRRMFRNDVESQGSALNLIRSAELHVEFRETSSKSIEAMAIERFTCSAVIVDLRGKTYSHQISGTWFPEFNQAPGTLAWLRFGSRRKKAESPVSTGTFIRRWGGRFKDGILWLTSFFN